MSPVFWIVLSITILGFIIGSIISFHCRKDPMGFEHWDDPKYEKLYFNVCLPIEVVSIVFLLIYMIYYTQ